MRHKTSTQQRCAQVVTSLLTWGASLLFRCFWNQPKRDKESRKLGLALFLEAVNVARHAQNHNATM